MHYFKYGATETGFLKSRDTALGRVIDEFGPLKRQVIPDLFEALINSIAGQQIASSAHATVWKRMKDGLGAITPGSIDAASDELLRSFGLSGRKAGYMKNAAQCVLNGELDIAALHAMPGTEVCRELTKLRGVGEWTAEMLLLFSLQRPNVLSYGDFGIRKGLCALHCLDSISKDKFQEYRALYSPYCSTASLYIWAVAGQL